MHGDGHLFSLFFFVGVVFVDLCGIALEVVLSGLMFAKVNRIVSINPIVYSR